MNIRYKHIDIVGAHHLEGDVPIVISGNHNNLYVDAGMMIYACERPVNFIMAAISESLKSLRFFTSFLNIIPTHRPKDFSFQGKGKIVSVKDGIVKGEGTDFLEELKPGDELRVGKDIETLPVKEVLSATEVVTRKKEYVRDEADTYLIWPKKDQSVLFKNVLDALDRNEMIGIFPEGGSHDQPKVLPIKAGACMFAYCAYQRNKTKVKMVEMGINYYGGHKSRSRVVVNIGPPRDVDFDDEKINDSAYKRATIEKMVEDLKVSMEDVKVCAPSYNEILNLYCAKELYLPDGVELEPEKDFQLFNKFAKAYYKMREKPEIIAMKEEVNYFRKQLKRHGLKIKELRKFEETFLVKSSTYFFYFLVYLILVSLTDFALYCVLFANEAYTVFIGGKTTKKGYFLVYSCKGNRCHSFIRHPLFSLSSASLPGKCVSYILPKGLSHSRLFIFRFIQYDLQIYVPFPGLPLFRCWLA